MLIQLSDAIERGAAMSQGYVPGNHRPTKEGVYKTRIAVTFSHDPEHETQYQDGYSFWDNMRQRWAAQRFTIAAANEHKYTAASRYNVDQTKDWKAA